MPSSFWAHTRPTVTLERKKNNPNSLQPNRMTTAQNGSQPPITMGECNMNNFGGKVRVRVENLHAGTEPACSSPELVLLSSY